MQPSPSYLFRSTLADSDSCRRDTPLGVVLIALYGLVCAILLGYGLWQGWLFNQFHPDLGQERLLPQVGEILTTVPLAIGIHMLLSVELLMLKRGARFGRIALSAANLVVYLLYHAFLFQEIPPRIDLAGHTSQAMLLADFLILCYLAFVPEATHAFRTRR